MKVWNWIRENLISLYMLLPFSANIHILKVFFPHLPHSKAFHLPLNSQHILWSALVLVSYFICCLRLVRTMTIPFHPPVFYGACSGFDSQAQLKNFWIECLSVKDPGRACFLLEVSSTKYLRSTICLNNFMSSIIYRRNKEVCK